MHLPFQSPAPMSRSSWVLEKRVYGKCFKGVANRVGYSGPPDLLHIQATGIALSDDKRLQSSHVRSWNEATLGEIVTDIIQVAGFKARVHDSLSSIEIKRHIQSIETDIEVLTQLMTSLRRGAEIRR